MSKNLEREIQEDPIEQIKQEIDVTVSARTSFDFKEALDASGREKSIYSACVRDLISLGEEYPVSRNKLNYLERLN